MASLRIQNGNAKLIIPDNMRIYSVVEIAVTYESSPLAYMLEKCFRFDRTFRFIQSYSATDSK
jgi:hypothetical protein